MAAQLIEISLRQTRCGSSVLLICVDSPAFTCWVSTQIMKTLLRPGRCKATGTVCLPLTTPVYITKQVSRAGIPLPAAHLPSSHSETLPFTSITQTLVMPTEMFRPTNRSTAAPSGEMTL